MTMGALSRPAARKRRRLHMLLLGLLLLGGATALVLTAFEDNLVFFYSPSDVAERGVEPGQRIRVGGLVEGGSVLRANGGLDTSFRITDGVATVPVAYSGILPDLFREGQGVIAQGRFGDDGVFVAHEVLARHDENYMPREVADALKASGYWEHWKSGESEAAGATEYGR